MVIGVQTFSEQMSELDIVKLLSQGKGWPEKKGEQRLYSPVHPFFREFPL
jgi:hypothetical protein